jgi:hypothetical protein
MSLNKETGKVYNINSYPTLKFLKMELHMIIQEI